MPSPPSIVVKRIDGFSSERDAAERRLEARSVALPVPQRAAWMRATGRRDTLLLLAQNGADVVAAAGVSVSRSRALPGHRIYRVERFGEGTSAEGSAAIVAALAAASRRDFRCLRTVVELFERQPDARVRLRDALAANGFSRAPVTRMYRHTRAVDIRGSEDEVFAAVNKTARRHVRAPAKRGLELREIRDPSLCDRIIRLLEESFARTDGTFEGQPWREIIAFSAAHPSLSRVVGLFDPATAGPDSLVSFAWGCAHGAYASYEAGATTRRPSLGSMPLSYAPLWDLIAWARSATPAAWFDLGGVIAGEGDQRFDGIDEFKRYFSEEIVEVGEDWVLEPHRVPTAIARALGQVARWAKAWRTQT